jgi:hypothetical protein
MIAAGRCRVLSDAVNISRSGKQQAYDSGLAPGLSTWDRVSAFRSHHARPVECGEAVGSTKPLMCSKSLLSRLLTWDLISGSACIGKVRGDNEFDVLRQQVL